MNMTFLTQFIDANKLGGWVRAGVASLLGWLLAHYAAQYPLLADVLSPQVQVAIGLGVSTAAVGLWSQLTKTDAAKVAAVEALPPDQIVGVVVATTATDGVLAASQNPAMPKAIMTTPAITAAIAAAPVTTTT